MRKPPVEPPVELSAAERIDNPPCHACLSAEDEREGAMIQGQPCVRCVNYRTCIMRAQRLGIWCNPDALARRYTGKQAGQGTGVGVSKDYAA